MYTYKSCTEWYPGGACVYFTEAELPKGVLTASCEAELQELMKQIDIMMATKKKDWEHQITSLQSKMELKDKESLLQKSTIEQKHKEIGHLRLQVETMEKSHRELVTCYEQQLTNLKNEVQKVKRDYERLSKKHVKQIKDHQRDKDKSHTDLQDSNSEIGRLNNKILEYRQKAKDWELQRRTFQKQIEALESQRKALTEKCEFIQSQSQTYQSQLDRRKQMLDSTELSLKNQITQLEGQLERTNDTLTSQETKVEKLKSSLDDAMTAHKKAMDDNEKLLNDLKKANDSIRNYEEEKAELESELRAKEDLLRALDEDKGIHSESMTKMEQTLAEKDEIIKSLSDIRQKEESDQIRLMRESLEDAKEEARMCRKHEKEMKEELSSLQSHLQRAVEDCERLTDQLEQKKTELTKLENGEVKRLRAEVSKLRELQLTQKDAYEPEVQGLKTEISRLTKDLHDRTKTMADLSEESSHVEAQLRNEVEALDRRQAELQVANAQIEALRLENRHLRQTILQQAKNDSDFDKVQDHLTAVQNAYTTTIMKLEQENRQLRDDLACLREEMNEMEEKFEEQLRLALRDSEMSAQSIRSKDDRRLQRLEEDSQRKLRAVQERLDSTVQRYEEEISYLRSQKARLEEQLDMERNSNYSQPVSGIDHYDVEIGGTRANGDGEVHHEADNSFETVLSSQAMSISESVNDYALNDDFGNVEDSNSRNSVSERFLAAENQRARELERLIDSHIEQLKIGTEATLRKYNVKR
ncbi:centrosomal protein of 63 kDa-like isoform X1 [Saccostrea echinata]|uniref:centrosomal protein of 63 kDa-like isoform X1 n=1 Tax=Saccostrea echinata TaxID=191078 RepID=UPI002A812281|nr:centrosomal protein of 63 kDa-like isoform X1 [Saccostrea echinata]